MARLLDLVNSANGTLVDEKLTEGKLDYGDSLADKIS
jgi:hypothetical protein